MANGNDVIPEDWKDKLFRKLDTIAGMLAGTTSELHELRQLLADKLDKIPTKEDEEERERKIEDRWRRLSETFRSLQDELRNINRALAYYIHTGQVDKYQILRRMVTLVEGVRQLLRPPPGTMLEALSREITTLGQLQRLASEARWRTVARTIGEVIAAVQEAVNNTFDRTSREIVGAIDQVRRMSGLARILREAGFPTAARVMERQTIMSAVRGIGASINQSIRGLASRFGTQFGLLRNVVRLLETIWDLIRLPIELVIMGMLMPFLILMLHTITPILQTVLPAVGNFVQWVIEGGLRGMFVSAITALGGALIASLFTSFGPIMTVVAVFALLATVLRGIIGLYNILRQRFGSLAATITTLITTIISSIVAIRMFSVIFNFVRTALWSVGIAAGRATIGLLSLATTLGILAIAVMAIFEIVNWLVNRQPANVVQYQTGGYVPAEGWYYLHGGEYVMPAHKATTSTNTFNITVNVNAEVSSDVDIDRLGNEIADRIMREIRMRVSEV